MVFYHIYNVFGDQDQQPVADEQKEIDNNFTKSTFSCNENKHVIISVKAPAPAPAPAQCPPLCDK